MRLKDTLFNWVQMRIVADARTEDRSARETLDFFADMLVNDHKLSHFSIAKTENSYIHVEYIEDGETKTIKFREELAEKLLSDINSNPKYNQ